ncbi:MAG TPA: GTPase Era [Candidatus Azosocius sp. HAIN]
MYRLHCGFIAIVGKTNVGKSSLLNCFIEKKISATSNKCNTTQINILGVYTYLSNQMIFVDTPGFDFNDEKYLINKIFFKSIIYCDIILYVIDPFYWNVYDDKMIKQLKKLNCNIILVINKIDKLNYKFFLLYRMKELYDKYGINNIIPISAIKNFNIDILRKKIIYYLPLKNHFYPVYKKMVIDIKIYISEIIREKLINILKAELSYFLNIDIYNIFLKNNIIIINGYIFINKYSQKNILLGYKGNLIKNISRLSRISIEKYFEKKVFLFLWVKILLK